MIKKRGTLYKGIGLHYESGPHDADEKTTKERQQNNHTGLKAVALVALVALAATCIFGTVSYYSSKQEEQKKEDLVWKARYELTFIKSDKTVGYLRLYDDEYKDGTLNLGFLVGPGVEYSEGSDTLGMLDFFLSLLAINQERWDSVFYYLNRAGVGMKVVFYNKTQTSLYFPDNTLLTLISNEKGMALNLEQFAKYKAEEILGYAKEHFKRDYLLTPDSVSLTDDLISLYLSYDDSKYILGKEFLDTTRVCIHFTDKVGEMGSIFDGMMSVCSRTDRGFAFIYQGKKNHTVHRLVWNKERTRELCKDYPGLIWQYGKKTNQVRTVTTKKKYTQ